MASARRHLVQFGVRKDVDPGFNLEQLPVLAQCFALEALPDSKQVLELLRPWAGRADVGRALNARDADTQALDALAQPGLQPPAWLVGINAARALTKANLVAPAKCGAHSASNRVADSHEHIAAGQARSSPKADFACSMEKNNAAA